MTDDEQQLIARAEKLADMHYWSAATLVLRELAAALSSATVARDEAVAALENNRCRNANDGHAQHGPAFFCGACVIRTSLNAADTGDDR